MSQPPVAAAVTVSPWNLANYLTVLRLLPGTPADGAATAASQDLARDLAEFVRGVRAPQIIIDPGTLIHEMRLVKSDEEVALMQRSADIAAEAHREAMASACPGMREYEIDALIEYVFRRSGAAAPAYNSIVGSGVNEWVHAAVAADVDLGFELDAAWVWGDATLLRELAANLIDNAIRYAGAGARITVRTAMRDGDGLLQVEDDGPGIAPAERERVQERFYRVAGSPGPGSGLGLAIVAEIVAMHGARLVLGDGESGRGLCATVRFAAFDARRPGQHGQPSG